MAKEKQIKKKGRRVNRIDLDTDDDDFDLASNVENLSLVDKNTLQSVEELPKNVLYYGWFFSNEVSLLIKEVADAYLTECLKVPQFERFLKDACAVYGAREPERLYRQRKLKSPDALSYHLTAKFLSREPNTEYSSMVKRITGKMSGIHLIGLFFTPKTFGIRVGLTEGQKTVFDEREGRPAAPTLTLDTTKRIPNIGAVSNKMPDSNTESSLCQNQKSLDLLENEIDSYTKPKLPGKKFKCKSSLHECFNKKGISLVPQNMDNFHPSKSRAHVTIGCSPKVLPIQTGIDLLDIIDLESRTSSNSIFHQDFPIDGGILRQYGRFGDAFVMYPCHGIVAEATFNYFI